MATVISGHSIPFAMLYYSWWSVAQVVLMRPGLWIQLQEGQLVSLYLLVKDPGPFTLAKSLINLCWFNHREGRPKPGDYLRPTILGDTGTKRPHLVKIAFTPIIGDILNSTQH